MRNTKMKHVHIKHNAAFHVQMIMKVQTTNVNLESKIRVTYKST